MSTKCRPTMPPSLKCALLNNASLHRLFRMGQSDYLDDNLWCVLLPRASTFRRMPTRATLCPFQNQQGLRFALFKDNSRLVLAAVFAFPRLRVPLHHGNIHRVSVSLFQAISSSSSPFKDSRLVLAAVFVFPRLRVPLHHGSIRAPLHR